MHAGARRSTRVSARQGGQAEARWPGRKQKAPRPHLQGLQEASRPVVTAVGVRRRARACTEVHQGQCTSGGQASARWAGRKREAPRPHLQGLQLLPTAGFFSFNDKGRTLSLLKNS